VPTATAFTADTRAGTYTVTASATGSSSTAFGETNLAGPASAVVVEAGNGQSAAAGSAFGVALSVVVEDADGNPVDVAGTPVTFSAPGSGANGTDTTVADTNRAGGQWEHVGTVTWTDPRPL